MVRLVLINTHKYYRLLRGLVVSLVLLNAIDGILTIFWINTGRFTEANPLMNIPISSHPVLFMLVKMLLVSLGTILLWRNRDHAFAAISIFFCFTVYCFVLTFHFSALNIVLAG